MYPQTQYRTFSTEEIRAFYEPRAVTGQEVIRTHARRATHLITKPDDVCIVSPFKRTEGPTTLLIPKLLPTDAHGNLVDLTEATIDQEHLICREMGLIRMETIYARLGHLVNDVGVPTSTMPPYGLLLGRPHTANALQLEIHYSEIPAWGHHHESLPAEKFPGEVLLHKSEPLNGIHWIDFWLIRIDDGFPLFREYYIHAFHNRLRKLNAVYF